MNVREFKKSDLGDVRELIYRTIDVCYRKDYCPEAIKFFKDWHRDEHILKDAENGYMIVLTENERIVATGAVNDGEIKRVFVETELQGKGFGRLIMEKLEERARQDGVGRVRLDASLPSEKFYDLLDYETTEKTYLEVENGKKLDYYKMEKLIK
jgi:GNAT superfamily N-acetyltransferase